MLDDVDERIGPHHGGHVQFDHLAGGVSPGVHDTGPRMRGFEATQHVALRVTIEMHARGGELPHTVGALAGQYLHGTGLAQTMPRGHRVGRVQFRVVFGEDRRGDAPLRMVGVGFHQVGLGDQRHVLAGIGHRQRRGKARDARADYDDFSVAHCAASSMLLMCSR